MDHSDELPEDRWRRSGGVEEQVHESAGGDNMGSRCRIEWGGEEGEQAFRTLLLSRSPRLPFALPPVVRHLPPSLLSRLPIDSNLNRLGLNPRLSHH